MPKHDDSADRPANKCPQCGAWLPRFANRADGGFQCENCGTQQSGSADADEDAYELEPPIARPKSQQWYEDESLIQPAASTGGVWAAESGESPIRKPRGAAADEEVPEGDPPWMKLGGALAFPWCSSVWQRWIGMTLALLFTGEILVCMFVYGGMLVGGDEGVSLDMVGGLVIGLPALVISLLCLIYLSALCLAVVSDTADGCHEIEGWPDPDPREWFGSFVFVLVAALAAGLAAKVSSATIGWWPLSMTAAFVVFPIALASEIETGTPWLPVSGPILLGMQRSGTAWVAFFVETALLFGGWIALAWALSGWPLLAAPLLAPLLAALILIYFCLLGRAMYAGVPDKEQESRSAAQVAR